jgi:DUF4097 and DUF4098 domain-containing protein YvlB
MLFWNLLSLLAAGTLTAQDAEFRRDGAYLVRTIDGAVPMAAPGRLQVITHGPIVLRGSSADKVTYKLIERVKARSQAQARRLFGDVNTTTRVTGDLTRLVVAPMASASVITRLEVNVPHQVLAAILETELGGIEAYDFDASLEAVTMGGSIQCDRISGSLVGRTGGGEIRLGKIGGPVRCISAGGSIYVDSAGGEANCETAGGDVVVREAGGPLVLATEGGNIQVERAASTVEAHSAGGVIEVAQAGGQVFADTRGGSIQVGSARGVRCESTAGTIRVRTASGPLRVSTALGSILAELLAGTRLEESSLVAGAGDITVLIPSNLALSVMARNDSGATPRIVSDFSEIRGKTIGFNRSPLVAEGAINGGGPVLRINAAGGTIYLRKLK